MISWRSQCGWKTKEGAAAAASHRFNSQSFSPKPYLCLGFWGWVWSGKKCTCEQVVDWTKFIYFIPIWYSVWYFWDIPNRISSTMWFGSVSIPNIQYIRCSPDSVDHSSWHPESMSRFSHITVIPVLGAAASKFFATKKTLKFGTYAAIKIQY